MGRCGCRQHAGAIGCAGKSSRQRNHSTANAAAGAGSQHRAVVVVIDVAGRVGATGDVCAALVGQRARGCSGWCNSHHIRHTRFQISEGILAAGIGRGLLQHGVAIWAA